MHYKVFSIVLFFFLLQGVHVFAQAGKEKTNLILKSQVLKEDLKYNLYLPAGYDVKKKYPVIYFLHWFGADNHFSSSFIHLVDSLILNKKFPEAIIISPDGKNTWYLDDYAGKYKYATMFVEEFIPYLKKTYSITDHPAYTAILGSSMGGFGALRFTMLNPQKFGICVSFMAGMSTREQIALDTEADYQTYHQKIYGENLKPSERANDYFIKNNPLYIAQQLPAESLKASKWYIQSCDNDYHSLANAALHAEFHKKNIQHEFRVNDGDHDMACVNNSMHDALNFINKNFILPNK